MEDITFVLTSLKEHLKQCFDQSILMQNKPVFQPLQKKADVAKKFMVFESKPIQNQVSEVKVVEKIHQDKTSVKSKIDDPKALHFKNLIQSIDHNFAFTSSILSDNIVKLQNPLLQNTATITFLKTSKSLKQKEVVTRLKRLVSEKMACVESLDLDLYFHDDVLEFLFNLPHIKLFIAPMDLFTTHLSLKKYLKIAPGKVLKKLIQTPLLTFDSAVSTDTSFETIKMCIERLKL